MNVLLYIKKILEDNELLFSKDGNYEKEDFSQSLKDESFYIKLNDERIHETASLKRITVYECSRGFELDFCNSKLKKSYHNILVDIESEMRGIYLSYNNEEKLYRISIHKDNDNVHWEEKFHFMGSKNELDELLDEDNLSLLALTIDMNLNWDIEE